MKLSFFKTKGVSEKEILHRRANRWIFVNLIVASCPILITFLIGLFFDVVPYEKVITSSFNEGTIIILAVGIAGNQYLSFAYSRDYDKLDIFTMNKISIGFWTILAVSAIGFTSLKIANSLKEMETLEVSISQNSTVILSTIIMLGALWYTRWAHLIALKYQRIEGNLVIPIIDNNDPGFEYRELKQRNEEKSNNK